MWPFSRNDDKEQPPVKGISVREVQARMKQGAVLVDVRSVREYRAVHPAGSINVTPAMIKEDQVGLPRDAEILVICLRGRRSPREARNLMKLGYTNVYDVLGGFDYWTKFGLPVKRSR
jgi:phage shock protein E